MGFSPRFTMTAALQQAILARLRLRVPKRWRPTGSVRVAADVAELTGRFPASRAAWQPGMRITDVFSPAALQG